MLLKSQGRLVFVLYLAILSLSTQVFAASISYTINFNQNDFTFRQENDYDVIEHPGFFRYGDIGAPQLLVTGCDFIIPIGETVQSITINSIQSQQFPNTYNIFPTQPHDYYTLCCDKSGLQWVEPDPLYYDNNNPYPQDAVVFGHNGYFDGANHIATIEVYPVYYHALDQTLFYYSSISFTISTGGASGDTPLYTLQRMRSDQTLIDNILTHSVVNPQDISTYGYTPPLLSDTSLFVKHDPPVYAAPVYQFAIITRDSLRSYWDTYLDWLNREGYIAGIVSMDSIVSHYGLVDDPAIEDNADHLRGYLRFAKARGAMWVILGGVSEPRIHGDIYSDMINVPARYAIDSCYNYVLPYTHNGDVGCASSQRNLWFPADIYFSDLTTDWEVNGNGWPGESNSPTEPSPGDLNRFIDNQEELFLARVPAINGQDIINWTNKIMNYEQNPGNGSYDYLLHAYFDEADAPQREDWDSGIIARFSNFAIHEISETPTIENPIAPYGYQVINNMSQWPAFISEFHHGDIDESCIRTLDENCGPAGRLSWLSASPTYHPFEGECGNGDHDCSMDDMINVDKPGFHWTNCCGEADWTCPYGGNDDPGYGAHERGIGCNNILSTNGAAGFFGTSREGDNGTAIGEGAFLDYILGTVGNGDTHIGPAKVFMSTIYGPDQEEWFHMANNTVLGSPEMPIWNAIPSHFAVTPDYANDRVRVYSGSNPLQYANVCFASRDRTKYCVTATDANGYASPPSYYNFDVNSTTDITVTKTNFIPYQIIGSGSLDKTLVWRGDIAFYGNVVVPAGKTLDIKPGAIVRVSNSELSVYGQLKIEGTSAHHVFFTSINSTPSTGDWTGIKVYIGGILDADYADIDYAHDGIVAQTSSSINAQYSSIKNFTTNGIECQGAGTTQPVIGSCVFDSGGATAISVINGGPQISGNNVKGMYSYGILYQGGSYPDIEKNILDGKSLQGVGIKITRYGASDVPKPTLIANIDTLYNYALELYYCSNTQTNVQGNKFSHNIYGGAILAYSSPPIIGDTYTSKKYNSFCDNGSYGIVAATSCNSAIRYNAIKRNGTWAVRVYSGANPNLGDATNAGNNSIWGTAYDGYNQGTATVSARGNWWNTTGTPNVYGPWNTSNRLLVDPFLLAKPALGQPELPQSFVLHDCYPNPFNPSTNISFELPNQQVVSIAIFNLLGQNIRTLANSSFGPGVHTLEWDGKDNSGQDVGSGVYFFRFTSEYFYGSKKMTLIR
jgi:hypothetical protein